MPTLVVVLAVVAGLALPRLDAHIDERLPPQLADLLFGGDAAAARTVLDTVASSLITVTALTFSLTVVTLQLASSQFSPRLLRTFTRDVFVQITLALFLGTFAYALSVLRSVRTGVTTTGSAATSGDRAGSASGFVPQLSVTLAFVLALASVVTLVLFLAHLARQIRVETMLATVRTDASATALARLRTTEAAAADMGDGIGIDSASDPLGTDHAGRVACDGVVGRAGAAVLLAPNSGFLTHLDEKALLSIACAYDLVIVMTAYPGFFLVEGTPVGLYWPPARTDLLDERGRDVDRRIRDAVHTGIERTESQDLGYGLRQLTDVAVKALSPGINDPTTAIHALNHTCALLCELAALDLTPQVMRDDHGRARVVLPRPDLGTLLDLALTQPRRYGAADPLVLARLFTLLAELAWHSGASHRTIITTQLGRLVATASAQDFDPTERTQMHDLADQVRRALTGTWTSPPARAWKHPTP